MNRRYFAAAALLVSLLAGEAYADSVGRLVSKGNSEYEKQQYDEAAALYEKASVKLPESGVIAFNLGDVLYRLEDYSGARNHFEDTAMKTRDLSLEAKAWYNMGNCAFGEGSRQVDSDMEKALEFYKESVSFYAAALEKDPDLSDAAHNMEIVRLYIKDLLDKIQKQKEEMQQMQEKMKEVVDSLLVAMDRQQQAQKRSLDLDDAAQKTDPQWKGRIDKLGNDQKNIERSTSDVRGKLDQLFPSEVPEPVRQASSHLDSAAVDQNSSVSDLSAEDPAAAAIDQDQAFDQMNKALELLTEGEKKDQEGQEEQEKDQGRQDQQNKQDEQPPPEQQEQQARSETARGILEEEKENRKKRKQQASGGYKKVEKDW